VSLDSLSAQQLSQVKKQLDEEVEHLTNSFTQLHAAQAKFKECLRCVKAGNVSSGGKSSPPVLLSSCFRLGVA
jgi:prefoldin subunit 5